MGENKSAKEPIISALKEITDILLTRQRNWICDNLIIWKNNHKEELLYKNANELIDEIAEMIRTGDI